MNFDSCFKKKPYFNTKPEKIGKKNKKTQTNPTFFYRQTNPTSANRSTSPIWTV
jgi:hypothetical protein